MQNEVKVNNISSGSNQINAYLDSANVEYCHSELNRLLTTGSKKKGAVIKLYLENFKAFNETFGYSFGGLFLCEVAKFLHGFKEVAALSGGGGVSIHRTAGVEFVIIINGCDNYVLDMIRDKIASRFEHTWQIKNLDCMCSANLAIAYYPGKTATAAEMMELLNYAVTTSAQLGPNRYCIVDETLRMKLYRRNSIAHLIPSALETGGLEVRYRPTYSNERRRFTRADSYLRLMIPEFGPVQAAEFIPVAEESGQIYLVSQYAITKACELASKLIKSRIEFERIAIPISPIQFLQERFVDDVKAALAKFDTPAERLSFEIADNVALSSFASSHSRVTEIADMGIEIVFSDFGTGFSGVANIVDLPVSAVKLGRLLIWQLHNDPNGPALVEGLIHIAKNLNLKVIAEGVENQTQVDLLKEYGCDYQQGFYYAPTLTMTELAEALQIEDF